MVARRAHNPKVVGSNPASATIKVLIIPVIRAFFFCLKPYLHYFSTAFLNSCTEIVPS